MNRSYRKNSLQITKNDNDLKILKIQNWTLI